jgi:hypothetical protein
VAHGGVRVEPLLIDGNGDGLVATACLGDENTQQAGSPLRFWCAGIDDLVTRPTWRTRNRGAPFATVYAGGTPAPNRTGRPSSPTRSRMMRHLERITEVGPDLVEHRRWDEDSPENQPEELELTNARKVDQRRRVADRAQRWRVTSAEISSGVT